MYNRYLNSNVLLKDIAYPLVRIKCVCESEVNARVTAKQSNSHKLYVLTPCSKCNLSGYKGFRLMEYKISN